MTARATADLRPDVSIVIIAKNEHEMLRRTLEDVHRQVTTRTYEVIVVDASSTPDASLRDAFTTVRWLELDRTHVALGKRITIPEQRNQGVRASRGPIVVFTDCGCEPAEDWLETLVEPITAGRLQIVAGGVSSIGDSRYRLTTEVERELEEVGTPNLAFLREVFETVDGFDESFDYCSDGDFALRVNEAGYRIVLLPGAEVQVDWGSGRRQLRRSYVYGYGRARLCHKHPRKIPSILRREPVVAIYPVFLLGLPISLRYRLYPLLLVIPLIRSRHDRPFSTVTDHIAYGIGALAYAADSLWRAASRSVTADQVRPAR